MINKRVLANMISNLIYRKKFAGHLYEIIWTPFRIYDIKLNYLNVLYRFWKMWNIQHYSILLVLFINRCFEDSKIMQPFVSRPTRPTTQTTGAGEHVFNRVLPKVNCLKIATIHYRFNFITSFLRKAILYYECLHRTVKKRCNDDTARFAVHKDSLILYV